MKYFWILSLILFAGCTETEQTEELDTFNPDTENVDPFEGLSEVEAIELHIRQQLSISVDEPIDYTIYEENCDGDDSLDAVIAVNLLDRAVKEAIQSGKTAKSAAIGYMGNYNYFIYRDGFTGDLSPAVVVPSSPKARLKVSFENVLSENQKDILIDYRILNAAYRNYFTISNGNLAQVNQLKLFDAVGTAEAVAFTVQYEDGMISNAKDIVSYKGSFDNPTFKTPDEVYSFEPDVMKTGEVQERWFFNPEDTKYYLKK
ncbi:MAG: hypothetical protein AB8B56_16535 [Crocinitomicaceae bacterium]